MADGSNRTSATLGIALPSSEVLRRQWKTPGLLGYLATFTWNSDASVEYLSLVCSFSGGGAAFCSPTTFVWIQPAVGYWTSCATRIRPTEKDAPAIPGNPPRNFSVCFLVTRAFTNIIAAITSSRSIWPKRLNSLVNLVHSWKSLANCLLLFSRWISWLYGLMLEKAPFWQVKPPFFLPFLPVKHPFLISTTLTLADKNM